MMKPVLLFPLKLTCAAVIATTLVGCDRSEEKPVQTALKQGFTKRGDVEMGDDGLTRLKGKQTPFSGQVVMRNKSWQMGYLAAYSDGKMHGPELRYYGDGVTLMRWYDWFLGEKVRHREFYENGQIKIDAMMKNGEAFGAHRTWAENGLLRFDGNFTQNLQWHGRIRDVDENGAVLWDAVFEKGRYVSGIYPKSHEQKLIDGGMLDAKTLKPIAK